MGKSFDPQSRQMVDGLAFVHRAHARQPKPNMAAAAKVKAVQSAIQAWEDAAGVDIIGPSRAAGGPPPSPTANGVNSIAFGNAGGGGTVAVTYVWGSRRTAIFEFDQIYGDNWDWTIGGSADTFDFLSVATHELGHAVGLGHPANTCVGETMYARIDFGETHQQTLNTGDVLGVQALY